MGRVCAGIPALQGGAFCHRGGGDAGGVFRQPLHLEGQKGSHRGGAGAGTHRQRGSGQDDRRRTACAEGNAAAGRRHRRRGYQRPDPTAGGAEQENLRGGAAETREAAADPQIHGLLPTHHPEAAQCLRPHGQPGRFRRQYRRYHGAGGEHHGHHCHRL